MPVLAFRPWRRLVLPLALLGVLGLAACGQAETTVGASPESTTGATTDPATPAVDAREQFRSCLAENGVTLPEPDGDGPSGGAGTDRAPTAPPQGADAGASPPDGGTPPAPPGVDPTAWDAALQACADLVPTRPS